MPTQLRVVSPVAGSVVMVATVMAITWYADFLPTRCLRDPRVNRISFTFILCQTQTTIARHKLAGRLTLITRVTPRGGRPVRGACHYREVRHEVARYESVDS